MGPVVGLTWSAADRSSWRPGAKVAEISKTASSWGAVGMLSALQGSQTRSPLSLRRGCFQPLSVEGWSYPRPPVSLLPRRPHRALDSETAVCGSQNREESQAEVGDKLREMTNYPSQHTKLGLGAEPWPGEAAHNYHILGVRKFPPLQDLTRS